MVVCNYAYNFVNKCPTNESILRTRARNGSAQDSRGGVENGDDTVCSLFPPMLCCVVVVVVIIFLVLLLVLNTVVE